MVLGASLGGLAALGRILAALPPGYALPVAVAQHRALEAQDDELAAYLDTHCPLPVRDVEDKEPVTPGRVALAPAGYHLLVEDGHYALSTDASVSFARPSVDVLFESAAEAYGAAVLAVVLTGANRDGAEGARAVHAAGGIVLVQDPATAECATMPAAAAPFADEVLELPDIETRLARLEPPKPRRGAPVPAHARRR